MTSLQLTHTRRPVRRWPWFPRVALVAGVLLAIIPVRTQQVNGWSMSDEGLTAFSTSAQWCASGTLVGAVFGRQETPRVESPIVVRKLLNTARCRTAGEPRRAAAVALLLFGLVAWRRRPDDPDRRAAESTRTSTLRELDERLLGPTAIAVIAGLVAAYFLASSFALFASREWALAAIFLALAVWCGRAAQREWRRRSR